jgi:uncharacterized protein (TIGR03435 family)
MVTAALAQTPESSPATSATKPIVWDVISIKPSHSVDRSGGMRIMPDGVLMRNLTILSLFTNAFVIRSDQQLIAAPAWTSTDAYDIEAKMDAETAAAFRSLKGEGGRKQWQALMRQIFEERFAMKYHVEQRELAVYDLVVAKQGLKMKESAADEKGASSMGPGRLIAKKGHVSNLIYGLPGAVGRLVIDKTGITGEYDIDLTWARDSDSEGPSIFTALEEQLGLKLETAKAMADVVVIDHIERPSEN